MLCALAACEITCDEIDESTEAPSVESPASLTELAQPVDEMEVRAERPEPRPAPRIERPAEPEPREDNEPLVEEAAPLPTLPSDPSKLMPQGVQRRIDLLGSPILRERLDLNVPLEVDPDAL